MPRWPAAIAHDFNNILGPIILHAEVSLTRVEDGGDLHESLEEILNSANRARNLVTQILGLSRGRERDKPVPFRLSTIAKECLKILRPTLSASITISYNNLSKADVVLADPTQVHQVLLNLLHQCGPCHRQQAGKSGNHAAGYQSGHPGQG